MIAKRSVSILALLCGLGLLIQPSHVMAKKNQKAKKPEVAKRTLRIAAVSVEQEPREVEDNLMRIEKWARKAAEAKAELVLFPEAAISGWWQNREIRKYGQPADGPAIQQLIKLAKELNIAMAVGMTETDGKKAHITHVFFDGHGVIGKHRKSSLAGGTHGEARFWDEGNDTNVFTYKNIKLGIAICYETVNPETCRALKGKGAEIILAPYANGTNPTDLINIEQGRENGKRTYVYDRAKENKVWVVACDATPHRKDRSLHPGTAYVISPTGRLVTISPVDNPGENMVVHTIELPALPEPVPAKTVTDSK